jgi:undecaprenyl pyrophosphate phosphatase UppP
MSAIPFELKEQAMIGEINIVGVFVPTVLVLMLVAYLIKRGVVALLALTGFYRFVWHRAAFDFCIYVFVLGAVVVLTKRFGA